MIDMSLQRSIKCYALREIVTVEIRTEMIHALIVTKFLIVYEFVEKQCWLAIKVIIVYQNIYRPFEVGFRFGYNS